MGRRAAASIIIAVTFLTAAGSSIWPAHDPSDRRLAGILRRLTRVARLYRDTALKFACNEQVSSRGLGRRTFTYGYVYEYDRAEGFRDYREQLTYVPPDKRDLGPPHFLKRAYSWAFLFSPGEQGWHHYWLVADQDDGEEALGRPAIKIRFEPNPPVVDGINQWYGHAWVDAETYQILKVESIHARDHNVYTRFQAALAEAARTGRQTRKPFLFDTYLTEFTVEKNGMRFPGRVVIERRRYQIVNPHSMKKYRAVRIFRIDQRYTDYRFFSIRTAEEILEIVLTGQGLAPQSENKR